MGDTKKQYLNRSSEWWTVVLIYVFGIIGFQFVRAHGSYGPFDSTGELIASAFNQFWQTDILLVILVYWKVVEGRFYKITGNPRIDVHIRNFLPIFFEMYLFFVVYLSLSNLSTLSVLWRAIYNPLYWLVVLIFIVIHIAARLGIGFKE